MKKIEALRLNLVSNIDKFCCPICGSNFNIVDFSLMCEKKHTFDLSSRGYVNFLTKNAGSAYSAELFDSRRTVFESGFFDPLLDALADYLMRKSCDNNSLLLDAGCGEGSALSGILERLDGDGILPIGLDISKDAVIKAASGVREATGCEAVWITGSISNIPLKPQSASAILNILSPADYAEFGRVAGGSGVVIKVVPGKDYLSELRKYFYNSDEGADTKSLEHFRSNMNIEWETDISYKYHTDKALLEKIMKMTPLCWNINESQRQKFMLSGIDRLTLDFKILAGNCYVTP